MQRIVTDIRKSVDRDIEEKARDPLRITDLEVCISF